MSVLKDDQRCVTASYTPLHLLSVYCAPHFSRAGRRDVISEAVVGVAVVIAYNDTFVIKWRLTEFTVTSISSKLWNIVAV